MSINLSGSLILTGSIVATGGITMSGSIASASFAVQAQTASSADNLTVRSTLTAQTLVVQTITSSVDFITGSTRFGSLLTNTHVFSGSVTMNPNGLFVSGSGLVGIGTTTPSYTLDVTGTGRFTNALQMASTSQVMGGGILKLGIASGNAGAALQLLGWSTSYSNWQIDTAYINSSFNITPSTTAGGSTFTTPALTITSAGATTFSSTVTAGGKITINKDLEALTVNGGTSTNAAYMSFQTNTQAGWMIVGSQGSTANYIQTGAGANESAITTVGAYALSLGTNQTERMRITSGGDLGVGTSTIYYASTNRRVIEINGTSSSFLAFKTSDTAKSYLFQNGTDFIITNLAAAGGYLALENGGGERMRISPSGDICAIRNVTGIAGSYINFSFGAAGFMGRTAYDSYFTGNVYYDSGGWKLKYASHYANVVNWYDGEYSFLRSTSAGATDSVVSLQANLFLDVNGNAIFRGSVTQNGNPSDINLKENLVKINSPLEKISQINGYNFDWKEGTPANGLVISVAEGMQAPESPLSVVHDAGLIAQEVELIMPELVRDNGHKSLNYNGIIALLIEGVKELKAENDTLKERITILEQK